MEKSSLIRAIPRLLKILRVLIKHKFLRTMFSTKHLPPPKIFRESLEELGLTFLKFGQVLAMRHDLLPIEYTDELELLHDHLPPMSIDVAHSTVEAELGAQLSELFSSFNEIPLAAATIAQVHEATLPDGRHVAVKVQRPNLKKIIAKDIAALSYLVSLGEKLFPKLRALDLPVVVHEFANTLSREIDFSREARSIVFFRTSLSNIPDLWIPDVIAEYSGETILTMEYSNGERVDLYAKKHPDEMPKIINTLVKLTLQSIFEDGLYHADPHPGNVFVLPDGRLSLLDFGMTGDLDESMRESLKLLLEAVVKGDAQAATDAYLEMAPKSDEVNHASLLVDIKATLYEIHKNGATDISIGNAFESLMHAGSRNGVHNPAEFFLLTRVFVLMESLVSELAPQHNYMNSFSEEITRLTKRHFSLTRIKIKTTKLARELDRLINDAPGDTRRILRRFADGNLGRLPSLEALGDRLGRDLGRLTGAIAYAALVIGASMLLMTPMGGWHDILGDIMLVIGLLGMLLIGIGALRRGYSQR